MTPIESALVKRRDAISALQSVLDAIKTTWNAEQQANAKLEELGAKLETAGVNVAMGTADESVIAELQRESANAHRTLEACQSTLKGLEAKRKKADSDLELAREQVARAACAAAKPMIDELETNIRRSIHATFENMSKLFRLGRGLAEIGAPVPVGANYSSFTEQDLHERLDRAARANGLARVRREVDAFSLVVAGMTENELLELIQ